ncbi:hypothetical protein GQ53DRAFT_867166 [Thozetella sp. PMI_491]|nr:hypothetical protein GQ53DRAFT_867166 [Thozetella sp. PMI_491]
MRFLELLTYGLASAYAAYPQLNIGASLPRQNDSLLSYMDSIMHKTLEVSQMGMAPACDLSNIELPSFSSAGLPLPSANLILRHIAIGLGTQNYTCPVKNSTAVPTPIGALATLFNASCIASTYPDLFNTLPALLTELNLSGKVVTHIPVDRPSFSGRHFFTNASTAFFDLDTAVERLGQVSTARNNTLSPPIFAPRGSRNESAVAWLKLLALPGATGGLQEVYRVQTAGGSAPKKCKGMPPTFEVTYSAQYVSSAYSLL